MSVRPDKERYHPELPMHIFLSSSPLPSVNLALERRNSSCFTSPHRSLPAGTGRIPDVFSFIVCNFPICPRTDETLTFPHPLGSPFRSAWRRSHRLHTNVGPQRQRGGRPPAPAPAPAPGRSRGRAAFCALSPRKI